MQSMKFTSKQSSRVQMQIKEVKDGILCLPNNEYRGVIQTSAVNFELKSTLEQDVLIDSFENFLNALPCHIQVLVRTREVDVDEYLASVSEKLKNETETVYKKQLASYQIFIKKLIAGNKILSRKFYLIYSYQSSEEFDIVKEQMQLLQNILIQGLERLSMKAKPLSTIDILKLFYAFYNPTLAKIQELSAEEEHDYVITA